MKERAIKEDLWELRSDGNYHIGYVWATKTTFYARGYGEQFELKVQGSSRSDAISKLRVALDNAHAFS